MPKIKQRKEEIIVKPDGTIIEQRISQVLRWGDEPNYIKLYLKDILYLHDMPTQYVGIVSALLKRMTFASETEGMCVILTSHIKKCICQEIGFTRVSSLDNAIQKLIAGKILYRIERSTYRFNPYLFGKGDWQDVAKLRLNVSYEEIKGRTFKANLEFKKRKKIPKSPIEQDEVLESSAQETSAQTPKEQAEGKIMYLADYLKSSKSPKKQK